MTYGNMFLSMSMLDECLFRGYGVSFVQFIDIKPSFQSFPFPQWMTANVYHQQTKTKTKTRLFGLINTEGSK